MTVGLIICGALGREVNALITKYNWDAEIVGIPAIDHVYPDRIAPDVEKRITEIKERYEKLIVVLGDCGSGGALDNVLSQYGIERVSGPHCYEMYAGEDFQLLMEEEPATFFLTDFMVRTFTGLIMKSMGLDKFPQLKEEYFRNYKRIVYLAQIKTDEQISKARVVAEYLDLPLVINTTGYGLLEKRLSLLMDSVRPE